MTVARSTPTNRIRKVVSSRSSTTISALWIALILSTAQATLPELVAESLRQREHASNVDHVRKRNVQTIARRDVLIVRVLDDTVGPENAETTNRLNQEVFTTIFNGGNGGELTPSVKNQMIACSAGQVILEPTNLGVITVSVNLPRNQYENRTAWVHTAAELVVTENGFDVDDTPWIRQLRATADHVVLILPEEFPDEDFLATAEIKSSVSTYSIHWSHSLSAYMHELAHNLGVQHAAYAGDMYGDTSGYMGRSNQTPWAPRKCYNAAQHWMLGWYPSNQRHSLMKSQSAFGQPELVSVAAFVDWEKAGNMAVLIQLDDRTFLQFNRAKSYNDGTNLMQDKIVIVSSGEKRKTNVVAGLGRDEEYQFLQNQVLVTVKVCEILIDNETEESFDFAVLSVGVGSACTVYNRHNDVAESGFVTPTRTPVKLPIISPVPTFVSVNVSFPTVPKYTPVTTTMAPTTVASEVQTAFPSLLISDTERTSLVPYIKLLLPAFLLMLFLVIVAIYIRRCCRKRKVVCSDSTAKSTWSTRVDNKHIVLQDSEDGDSLSILFSRKRISELWQGVIKRDDCNFSHSAVTQK